MTKKRVHTDVLQMITVRLCNMIIYGYHGVLAEEKSLGQRFEIDIEFQFPGQKAVKTDQLKHTVSYEQIFQAVHTTVTQHRFHLLETLGHEIIKKVRLQFPMIMSILIRIRKPSVPIPGILDHVEVELCWEASAKEE